MAKVRFIRPQLVEKRANQPRCCTGCGDTYHRVNKIEVWDVTNPGSRTGWHKTKVKLCMKCQKVEQARRVLFLAHITPAVKESTLPRVTAKTG